MTISLDTVEQIGSSARGLPGLTDTDSLAKLADAFFQALPAAIEGMQGTDPGPVSLPGDSPSGLSGDALASPPSAYGQGSPVDWRSAPLYTPVAGV